MNPKLYDANIEAGVRAIYRSALSVIGFKMKWETPTEILLRYVINWDAPLRRIVDSWEKSAAQKEGLEPPTRIMIHDIARKAWKLYENKQKDRSESEQTQIPGPEAAR